jgi:pimeloyl-ACP methyl ester carboxylesterase
MGRALGRVASQSPTLGARLLEHVFLSTRRHPSPERERAWLGSAEEFSFDSRGRRLGAWTWGAPGPAVLLVHGWEGRGAQLGAFVEPLLSKGFRVVTFDGPGHGTSPGRRSSLVEMGAAVLDAARVLGPFHGAIAHSAGAAATTLALHDGASIERLVYVAPPADLGEFLGRVASALGLPAEVVPIARRRIAKRFGFRWETIAHVHLAQSMSAPLLVIHDASDREIEVENGVRLTSIWPESRLEITSGLGHRRILRDERVVSRAVGFLAVDRPSHAGIVGTALAPSDPSSAEARTTRSFPPVFAR